MRRMLIAALALVLVGVCGYGLLAGPLRDTDMSRFVHGDLTRDEALDHCAESADFEIEGTDVPSLSSTQTKFEGREGLGWTIEGILVAGDVRGPFKCRISWTTGGATSYTEYISLPNGDESGIDVPD